MTLLYHICLQSSPGKGRKSSFVTTLTSNDYYLQYEIKIGVRNRIGYGPNSTIAVIYSAEGSKLVLQILFKFQGVLVYETRKLIITHQ